MPEDFLAKLTLEAQKQAGLNRTSLLPKALGGVASLIAKYPWQTCLILALLTAIFIEFF